MSTDLILVLDVGNSGAKLGVVRGEDVAGPVRLPRCDGPAVREFAKPLVKDAKPLVAVCGSDSGKAKDLAWELGKVGFPGAIVVSHDHAGLPKSTARQPDQAGVDRRVQALAAATLAAGPAIIVSAGTALTVDLAGRDGALLGGTIGAGLGLAARALTAGAEKLPLVDLKGAVPLPALDTESAIRSGVVLGARVPIALTSRADGATARLASAALAVLLAHSYRVKPL